MRRDEDKDEVTATCMNQEKERKKERKNRKVLEKMIHLNQINSK